MTTTDAFEQEQAEFAQAEINRLLDLEEGFPPFEGPWAKALAELLRKKYAKDMAQHSALLNQVLACFAAATSDPKLENLWVALSMSIEDPGPQNEHDETWLAALAAFAALLTIDRPQWKLLRGSVDQSARSFKSGVAPTKHLGLAAAVFGRLVLGLRFEGLSRGGQVYWQDVDISAHKQTDIKAAILSAYLAALDTQKGGAPSRASRNPDQSYEALLTQLAAESQKNRFYGIASGVGVRKPPELTPELWEAALIQLADILQTNVIGLADCSPEKGENLVRARHPVQYRLLAFYLDQAQGCLKQTGQQQKTPHAAKPEPQPVVRTPVLFPETPVYEFDFFLSHASEDKIPFVDDLAWSLKQRRWRVWYDKDQMGVGSNLLRELQEGLKKSQFAVLVISPQSVSKPGYVQAEWESVLGRDITGSKPRILPVLLNYTHDKLQQEHPFLARLLSVEASHGVRHVVDALERAVVRINKINPQG